MRVKYLDRVGLENSSFLKYIYGEHSRKDLSISIEKCPSVFCQEIKIRTRAEMPLGS
jgi:hypothetical protein